MSRCVVREYETFCAFARSWTVRKSYSGTRGGTNQPSWLAVLPFMVACASTLELPLIQIRLPEFLTQNADTFGQFPGPASNAWSGLDPITPLRLRRSPSLGARWVAQTSASAPSGAGTCTSRNCTLCPAARPHRGRVDLRAGREAAGAGAQTDSPRPHGRNGPSVLGPGGEIDATAPNLGSTTLETGIQTGTPACGLR